MVEIGGRTRTRTVDPLIKSQLLCQLSYAPLPLGRYSKASLALQAFIPAFDHAQRCIDQRDGAVAFDYLVSGPNQAAAGA